MKTSFILASALLFAGCNTGRKQDAVLTQEQAQKMALQLANDRAATIYHCQAFRMGRPAHLVQGCWVWVGRQGYGRGDLEATVKLAADGSTNSVDLKLLDSGRNML